MYFIRKIIHIDMDAFYASVEQRDNPQLKGRPVIVGGDPSSRGVVAACSYEARRFGIHSAMACATAYRLCPQAFFIRPRFDVYKTVSHQIREIFFQYTDLVEPLSLDEAFLDVTHNKLGLSSATQIAQQIRTQIVHVTGGLTASAGVSFNKFLAKVASDCNKPNGITVITPDDAPAFIDQLPIRRFFGVGRVTEERMLNLGIKTGADLKKISLERLVQSFGKVGAYYYHIAHGRDDRPVQPNRTHKSYGKEITLTSDIDDTHQMIVILDDLARKVADGLRREDRQGLTLTLKVKYHDFQTVTRSVTFPEPITSSSTIIAAVKKLLANTDAGKIKVRLLGITVSNFLDAQQNSNGWVQLPLPFKDPDKNCWPDNDRSW
ncbi:DinB: DNA polymerase IV [Desulfosarcina variabilis str. Montpellier]|uniref:DNA polymerase IV n=1 Tax=Desulfosarcina variabilis TaxID=2300 RepID=UPI003AFB6FED